MAREFPLWVIVALPWFAALCAWLLGRTQVRLLGSRKATVFAQYLALGASALALLFTLQAIEHLRAPEDPRALAHTPFAELLGPIVVGSVRIELTLVADRLSSCAALVIALAFTLARMFLVGPTGQRELGLVAGREPEQARALTAMRRLGLLGMIEGAASLVVLAGDLGLAAIGWAVLGIAATLATVRELGDERRTSAAMRVLACCLLGDLLLAVAAVSLVVSRIGLPHNEMWAPLTGDRLYSIGLLGVPTADLIAAALVAAVLLRWASTAWYGNSLAEALLDAVAIPLPAIYLLLRYQRVLSYAPTVLAWLLVLGMVIALIAVAIAMLRPSPGRARRSPRPGDELGLAGTGLAWTGLLAMAIGVGAWRTAVLLLLAHAIGRLGLRLALLLAGDQRQLPPWSARIDRLLAWAVAGIAPGLAFVAIAQTLVDVLTRTSLLAPWISWPAAIVVLLVAFAHAAAIARIWYESLAPKPGVQVEQQEDGLDFVPLALLLIGSLVLGLISLAAWFELSTPLLAWLELVLPLAGGHEAAPLGLREQFRDGLMVARPWVAGSGVLLAIVTGFAWTWTRERFRRAHGGELSSLVAALERLLAWPRRIVAALALVLEGLAELAARGLGRGLFDEGPRLGQNLARDLEAGLTPRLRRLGLGGARQAVLGLLLGFVLLFGWLYGKREVASVLPSDDYGFGGLRPKLIRAGGNKARTQPTAAPAEATTPVAEDPASTPVAPLPVAPRSDEAEPAPIPSEEGVP